MKIEITNQQTIKRIKRKETARFIKKVLNACKVAPEEISFVFCDDRFITKLNKKVFNRCVPTDVIAFPFDSDNLGEVVVSVERAIKVCAQYGNSWEEEFHLYIIHGILHLLGYEDTAPAKKKKMFRKQGEIFNKIVGAGSPRPYSGRGNRAPTRR